MGQHMTDEVRIDISDLTLGEAEEFEEITGLALSNFGEGKPFPAKAIVALVYLTQHRTDPDFTLDDARGVRMSALSTGSVEVETDPTSSPDASGAP